MIHTIFFVCIINSTEVGLNIKHASTPSTDVNPTFQRNALEVSGTWYKRKNYNDKLQLYMYLFCLVISLEVLQMLRCPQYPCNRRGRR